MINNVNDFLQKSVAKHPNKKLFVEFDGKYITYKEFDLITDKLASKIIQEKIYQSPILIILPKSINALISFFGVIKSGNFYTILDEKTPKEKIKKIMQTLKPKLFISSKEANINLDIPTIYTEEFQSFITDIISLTNIKSKHIDTNLLYVLFTSGSTGIPKGVSITHKSVINYTFWMQETFNIDSSDIIANQTQLYFDVSVADIYTTIKAGATLHLLPNHLFAFPNKIMDYLVKHEINTIFWVPSVLIYFANEKSLNKIKNLHLNKILFAGEIMPNKQLNIWRRYLPNALFANLYGPTEVTIIACFYIVNRSFNDNELLPIGKSCKNTELLVFDENLNLITSDKVGIKGELYVRGISLSLGYYNDKEKTSKAFVQNPLHDNYLDLLYKTGDIVSYNEFGELLCYGRIDNQIKYMGYRIELGEIETIINSHEKIKNSICIFKDKIICFYESDEELDLKSFCKERLIFYMLPSKFIKIDSFKLNQNGKIDRNYLKEII